MRDSATFARLTNSPKVAYVRELPENAFWSQAQTALRQHLLQADYGSKLYVSVMVAGGKTVSEIMFDFLRGPNDPVCLLLIGQYGIGKTSAIFDLKYRYLEDDQAEKWGWIYLDANERRSEISQDPNSLVKHLAEVAATATTQFFRANGWDVNRFVTDVFTHDRVFAVNRQFVDIPSEQQLADALAQIQASPATHLNVNLRFLSRQIGKHRVVLIIDNLDSQHASVQFEGVKLAADLAASCKLKAIVPVRRTTESELRYNHKDVFAPFVVAAVQPPDMIEVIRRRIIQALETPDAQEATLGDGALRAKFRECPEFAEVLVQGLSAPRVSRLLNGLANESVREALHFAMHVYSSNFLDARRIIRRISPANRLVPSMWHGSLPYYVVLKALVLQNWPIYKPEISWIGNALATSIPSALASPFLRVYILSLLQHYHPYEMEIPQFSGTLQELLRVDPQTVELELKWLVRHDWVSRPDPAHVKLTARGYFVRNTLIFDSEYLTHISTDVRMYPEMTRSLAFPADTMNHRVSNLLILLEFLVKRECELMTDFARTGLSPYFLAFGRRLIAGEMVREAERRLEATDVEADDHREEVVKGALSRVRDIRTSKEWRTLHQLLSRY